jgi:hypothetical protein
VIATAALVASIGLGIAGWQTWTRETSTEAYDPYG